MNNSTQALDQTKTDLVVMLPGLNGSGLELGQLPRYLEENNYVVALPHIEGFEYGQPASNIESWIGQLNQFLDDQEGKYSNVHLLGISMGSTLALAVAEGRSDIKSLVLLSPVLRYDGWTVPWYRPLLDVAYFFGIRNWEYREREPFGLKNVDLRRRIAKKFETSKVSEVGSVSISAGHLWQAKRLMNFVRAGLEKITSNLLVIQAIEDDTCSVWGAETILKTVSSDLRRSSWLGNSYHIITIDNEREFVLNEVLRFVDAVGGHESGVEGFHQRPNLKKIKARGLFKN